ncbi:MAG: PfkB family carbohydrate kinase [Thermaerobacter sp.]|nr:PfkB family carbohydrate kinase [Thermaerobacter sp.]
MREQGNQAEAVIVSDQWVNGVITENVRTAVSQGGLKRPTYVDSRIALGEYRHVMVKPNEWEFAEALQTPFAVVRGASEDWLKALGGEWVKRADVEICLTRADYGVMWVGRDQTFATDAPQVGPPIDPVGAGDAYLAAFAGARTVGATVPEALLFGSLATSIVLQKIGTTGSATAREMTAAYARYRKNQAGRDSVESWVRAI